MQEGKSAASMTDSRAGSYRLSWRQKQDDVRQRVKPQGNQPELAKADDERTVLDQPSDDRAQQIGGESQVNVRGLLVGSPENEGRKKYRRGHQNHGNKQ